MSAGHRVVCVVTQPDKQKGRGLLLGSTAIKDIAKREGLDIYQPVDINAAESVEYLKDFLPDLFVVVAYGQILSQKILDMPSILSVNVHASLLPKYRGAAPINWAVINGDKNTGVTIIKMNKKMDAGDILLQKAVSIIKEDTAVTMEDKLSKLGAQALLESVRLIKDNAYQAIPQDDKKLTLAPKLHKDDGLIDWNRSAREINNLIRGCLEWPGAFTHYKGKILKVYKSSTAGIRIDKQLIPGEVIEVSNDGICVATSEGSLSVEELQLEGGKRMSARDFLSGHKLQVGEVLGKN